ncbi:helix-turn-helix domain-containing protein [Streptomyces lavendulocolor]|uniref:helix-turn-helix domain-containing protein n=1 Tax=Streptomyces lavendulocolor TaxID=67316 RepID=UPI003F4D51D2
MWRGRFAAAAVEGLKDAKRAGRPRRYGPEMRVAIVAAATCAPPHPESCGCTARSPSRPRALSSPRSPLSKSVDPGRPGPQAALGARLAHPPRHPRLLGTGRRNLQPLPRPARRCCGAVQAGELRDQPQHHRDPYRWTYDGTPLKAA